MRSYKVEIPEAINEKFLLFMNGILGIAPQEHIVDEAQESIPPGILADIPSALSTFEEVETGPITQADILAWAKEGDVTPKTVRLLLEGGVDPEDLSDVIALRASMIPVRVDDKGKTVKLVVGAAPTVEAMIAVYHQCDQDVDILAEAVEFTPELLSPDNPPTPRSLNAALYKAVKAVLMGQV